MFGSRGMRLVRGNDTRNSSLHPHSASRGSGSGGDSVYSRCCRKPLGSSLVLRARAVRHWRHNMSGRDTLGGSAPAQGERVMRATRFRHRPQPTVPHPEQGHLPHGIMRRADMRVHIGESLGRVHDQCVARTLFRPEPCRLPRQPRQPHGGGVSPQGRHDLAMSRERTFYRRGLHRRQSDRGTYVALRHRRCLLVHGEKTCRSHAYDRTKACALTRARAYTDVHVGVHTRANSMDLME